MTDMMQLYEIVNAYEDIDMECFSTVGSDSYTFKHLLIKKMIGGNMVSCMSTLFLNNWNGLPTCVLLIIHGRNNH